MYQVLARKWRPQTFADLVGQTHVTTALSNAIGSDRLAHAYIFAGLRGTGKTTVARILAKCLNCEKGVTTEPDGECASCEEVAQSRSMDVLEIDAASRTKVEQTRELLEMVSYAPVRDRFKILIIDEAHMLSKASFNALLKTLEEPPPNVMFILATTELQKILPTILSRCQIFEFRRVAVRELAEYLESICKAEGIEISVAALERVARAGEGSVRDSLSVLERVLAFCGKQVDDDDVLRMLGGVRAEVLSQMIGAMASRDAGAMLEVLDGLVDEGHDLLHFWSELLSAVRDLLLVDAVPGREELLLRSTSEIASLSKAAEGLSRDDLNRVFQLLADLEPPLKASSQPRFMFESMLIRLASLGAVRPIEEVLATLGGRPTVPTAKRPAQKKSPEPAPEVSAPVEAAPPQAEAPEPEPAPRPAAGGIHGALVSAVIGEKPMAGTLLEQAKSIRLDDGDLLIGFPEGQEHLMKPLQRDESMKLLERHAAALSGETVRVRFVSEAAGTKPEAAASTPPAPEIEATEPPPKVEKAAGSTPPEPRGNTGDLLAQAREEPGVQKLLREFGAQVVAIKPDGAEDVS